MSLQSIHKRLYDYVGLILILNLQILLFIMPVQILLVKSFANMLPQ